MYPDVINRRRASMNEQKILHFLDEHADEIFSVDSLFKKINKRHIISRGTVSRILRALTAKNEVSKRPAFGGKILYQRKAINANCRIIWTKENRTLALNDHRLDSLIESIAIENGGVAIEHEFTIYIGSEISLPARTE